MLIFEKDSNVFVFRVAGVAINNNKLLIHRSILDDFWTLPGGRCEFFELSKDTLIREMKEELNVEIKIIRPLYFVENFFNFEEKDYHELSIFYLMAFHPDAKLILESNTFTGKELDLIFKWIDIDQLEEIRLYPLFLHRSLNNIKPYPEHIINWDD